jgi:hypothetical protein
MKVQENYFYRLDNLKDVKVVWKKYDKANILEIGIDYPTAIIDLDRFSGIPITEDWLLKFGFEMYEFDNKTPQFRFKEMLIIYREGFLYDYGTGLKIDYVHQLQNLYFALSQQELIFNNEKK